ncbi:MAG TPA: metal-dependent hydrolase [Pseudogracilibacillus sp.]|nr:metal-dependent hydrolase [Pseudogracilibacillus sp.]
MDTGTHIAMGVALGGLATIDPVVASDQTLFHAVFVGTVAGSLAPDFDTVLKLKNNATYIRNHRGFTHSIPMVIFWGLFISAVIYFLIPEISFLHLWLWTFLAVILHVVVDIFNAYGTQALRPLNHKWIALGFINTFDPYIFLLLIGGIIAWFLGANPVTTFLIIFFVIVLYYVKRYLDQREIVKKVYEYFPSTEQVVTSPTLKQNYWRIAITTADRFYVGTVENGHIQLMDEFERIPLPDAEVMNVAKQDKNIAAFLSFSPVYRWEISEYDGYTEVRFFDLRYRNKGYYPFVAVAQINRENEITNSYTGWIFSEQTLQKKLYFGNSPT